MALSDDTRNRMKYALASNAAGNEVIDAIDAGEGNLASGKINVGDSNGVAQERTLSGDVTVDNTGVTAIGAGKVTQAMVSPNTLNATVAANNAADNVIGSIPVVFRINIAAGALATKNVVMTHKVMVIDAYVVLAGAGVANTVLTVGSGANIITNTIDVSGSDTAVIRATTINDANQTIAAGGDLRIVTTVGATQPDCVVYVTALRIA